MATISPSTASMGQEETPNSDGIARSHRRPFLKSLVYGRTILNALLIALQLAGLALFFWRVIPAAILLASQYVLAVLFLIYLANSKGRNEYKLSWLVPVLVLPVFGIVCYVLTHLQGAPRAVKRRLRVISDAQRLPQYSLNSANAASAAGEELQRSATSASQSGILSGAGLPPAPPTRNPYPRVDDIAHYLWAEGCHALYNNCEITYYPMGELAFPVMLEKLRAAKSFIFVEFFLIKRGWMWSRLLEALSDRAAAGVEVRLIFDALGSITLPAKATVKELNAKGIKAVAFAPMVPFFSPYLNNRDHRKIIVIDGQVAFTGGINIGDEYIGRDDRLGKWKDNSVMVRGSAVASFTQMFKRLWDVAIAAETALPHAGGAAAANHTAAQNYYPDHVRTFVAPGIVIPYCDDAYNGKDVAENVYHYVISNAKKYIHITTPYVALDNRLQEALLFAAKGGIDVQIIVPRSIDHYLTYCIGRTYLSHLTAGGVKVYEYTPGFIHAKMIIADGENAVVGTVNFDYRSLFAQFEDAIFMHKGTSIYAMESDFIATRGECTLLTPLAYKQRPIQQRILGFVGRLFAPLV